MPTKKLATVITKLALALSIVIMMNLFFYAGLEVFNPRAEYEAFCPTEMWEDQAVCEEYGGTWMVEEPAKDGTGYCLENRDCWKLQVDANETVEELNFMILAGLGVLALIAGAVLSLPSAVSTGLMYGGVLSILIGWIRAAQYLDELAHFIISGIFLVVLIILGVKKMKD